MVERSRLEVDIQIGEIDHSKHVNRDRRMRLSPAAVGMNSGMGRVRFPELVVSLTDLAKPCLSEAMEG
jgi:hypothetical protein